MEIFLDTNHDSQTYFQYVINTIGTVYEVDAGARGEGQSWNSDIRVGMAVADTFWIVEVAIPAATLKDARFAPGDIWGFNIARARISNASEYAQWTPTYEGGAHRPDRFGYLLFE